LKKLVEDLGLAIRVEPDLNHALEMARIYGSLLWFADFGIYDAPVIESNLIERCANYFKGIGGCSNQSDQPFVHVVTEPLMTGGHTRLMEKLAVMHDSQVDLVISRRAPERVEQHLSQFFKRIISDSSGTPIDAVINLVKILSSYKKIILHIHPDDIISVVACGVVKRLSDNQVYFVNHADHVFSYGTTVADYYFELSSYGRRLDEKKSIYGKKSFLGIPVKINKGEMGGDFSPDRQQSLLFISAGSDIKYKPNKKYSIFKLVACILDSYPESRFIVIGSNIKKSFWWWPLKIRFGKRLDVRAHLEYEEYKKVVQVADYYVDSHPIPGGTAFAEQFLSGRRCVGLISPIQGYSPADRLKRNSIKEVIESVSNYKYSSSVFDAIVKVNGIESVKYRYLKCVLEGEVCENLLDQSNNWSGDVNFFKLSEQRADVNISVDAFLSLFKLKRRLAVKLLSAMSFQKKIKLILKIVIYKSSAQKR
jgi:hypothetical protein